MFSKLWTIVCQVWDVLFVLVFILMWPVLIGMFGALLWMIFWAPEMWNGTPFTLYCYALAFCFYLLAWYYYTKTFMILGWFR